MTPEESREDGRRDKLNGIGMVRSALAGDGAGLLLQAREAEDKVGSLISLATMVVGLLVALEHYTKVSPEVALDRMTEGVVDP